MQWPNPRNNQQIYFVDFSNVLRKDWLKDLAIADKKKIVETVQVRNVIKGREPAGVLCWFPNLSFDVVTLMPLQEYYGDYNAINRHLFTINIPDR